MGSLQLFPLILSGTRIHKEPAKAGGQSQLGGMRGGQSTCVKPDGGYVQDRDEKVPSARVHLEV